MEQISHPKTQLVAFYCKAVGHPIRSQILQFLKQEGPSQCGLLVEQLPVAQATVSQHLKILLSAGLINGKAIGTRVIYSVNEKGFESFKQLIAQM